MELKTEELLGKGASLPFNKVENIYILFDQLFAEVLSFKKYKYFLVNIVIVDEEENLNIPQKHIKDTFIVECKYPISKFSDLLISERVVVFTQLVLKALFEFYKYHDQDLHEVEIIESILKEKQVI